MRRLLLSILLALPGMGHAATLTFDSIPVADVTDSYSEAGYTFTPVDLGGYGDASLHLDICCALYTRHVALSRSDGARFAISALDIRPLGLPEPLDPPLDDLRFRGIRGGLEIADAFATSQSGASTFAFGAAFARLDRLEIFALATGNRDPLRGDIHMDLDNFVVEVAAVPLPGAGLLLTAGLAALFGRRLRA